MMGVHLYLNKVCGAVVVNWEIRGPFLAQLLLCFPGLLGFFVCFLHSFLLLSRWEFALWSYKNHTRMDYAKYDTGEQHWSRIKRQHIDLVEWKRIRGRVNSARELQ